MLHHGLHWGCRSVSALAPGALLPLLLWPWCLQGCSSLILTPFSHTCSTLFYPFSNLLSQRHHQHLSQAQSGQFGFPWSWLCLTRGQLLVSSHRCPDCSCYQTLPYQPVTHTITQKQNLFQVIKSNITITAHTDSWLYTQVKNSMTKAQLILFAFFTFRT